MNNFVKGSRVASPHNGQPTNSASRRTAAAGAKVSAKDLAQKPQSQLPPGLPSRGFGNAQNSSATMQQRPPGHRHARQHDAYDTDAESLDTTVNASVAKDENNRTKSFQHQQHDETVDQEESSDSDEPASEGQAVYEEGQLNEIDIATLRANNVLHLPYQSQVEFLQSASSRQGFRTMPGDSYPPTTDGEPTQWEEQQLSSEDYAPDEAVIPARLAVKTPTTRPITQQAQPYGQLSAPVGHGQKPSAFFQKGSTIRAEQRIVPQTSQRAVSAVQSNVGLPPFSQPPTYTQTNGQTLSTIPIQLNGKPAAYGQSGQAAQPLKRALSNPHRMQLPRVQPMAPSVHANGRAVPGSLRRPAEDDVASETSTRPNEDYNHENLLAMKYDDLKTESFDLDPRAKAPVLGEDILQKPLIERLEYVQKNLDAERQSEFFPSLPTTEWEDAGDWFLDQFQRIIQRTREARQTKRKLAQGFEEEVEKRYKHVSKKQHQVEGAMEKMKQQGEGLVPKSPRPSKSPQPKKRGHA